MPTRVQGVHLSIVHVLGNNLGKNLRSTDYAKDGDEYVPSSQHSSQLGVAAIVR